MNRLELVRWKQTEAKLREICKEAYRDPNFPKGLKEFCERLELDPDVVPFQLLGWVSGVENKFRKIKKEEYLLDYHNTLVEVLISLGYALALREMKKQEKEIKSVLPRR